MTRKKSAAPLAMRFLVCLALLAPCAGLAGADQLSIYSWTGWRQSTQVDYDDAVPWGGVSSLPAPGTFTEPTQVYTGPYLESVPWPNTPLYAGPGVRYFHALFDMPDFGNIVADLQISVDNDVEIYINRHLLARAGSLSVENFRGSPLSVSLGSGGVDNGAFDLQPFDWAAPTSPRTNWIRGGINEVLLVVRNLSYEPGGFSFVMNITTYPNNPPVANSDAATTAANSAVTLAVLANDTDPDGDILTVTAVTQGENGTVVLNPDGTISYTPNSNSNGQDSFTYTLSDGIKTATGTVSVTVAENLVNTPPTAVADSAEVLFGGTKTIDVKANDRDIDGDALTVTAVTQPAFGRAEIADNKVVYTNTASSQSTSDDSLSYTVSDGHGGTATATLKLKLVARLPALSVPGPLTIKAGMPLRFTVKAQDPNYSPPAALSTEVVSRTLPAGASFRNDTLSWTPQSDQVGTYNLVFGARTNTSPSQLLTKAVAVTVKPSRYPSLILGGEPGYEDSPAWVATVMLGGSVPLKGEGGYILPMADWVYSEKEVAYPAYRTFLDYPPGVHILGKQPTSTLPGRGFEIAEDWYFERNAESVYSNYLSRYSFFSAASRPAAGDLDGVSLAEVVVGAGPGSDGLLAVISPSRGGQGGWTKIINAGWDEYNQANGETWPAVGNLNGTDYILVGLGKGGFGYIQAFLWRSGEIVYGGELYLPDANNYNATNGTTRPTVGDLTGDGNNEIVVGVDGYGDGIPTRVYIMTLAADGWHYTPLEIPAVAGLEDARYNCETWPAIGDLNGDGKNELVINVTKTVNGTRQPVGFGVWTSAFSNGQLTFKLQAFKKAATFGLPALGDVFTPDGKAEIVLSQGPGSYTLSVFDAEIANGGWTILPEGTLPSYLSNPYPAFGEIGP